VVKEDLTLYLNLMQDITDKKKRIIKRKIVRPFRFGKCLRCKRLLWPWQKRTLLVVKFNDKLSEYFRCLRCKVEK